MHPRGAPEWIAPARTPFGPPFGLRPAFLQRARSRPEPSARTPSARMGGEGPSRGLRRPSGRPAEALDEPQRDGRRLAEGGEQASGAASEESGRGAKGRPPAERRLGKIPPTAGAGNGVAACISAKTALRAGSRAPTCREKPEDPPSGRGSSNKRGHPGECSDFRRGPDPPQGANQAPASSGPAERESAAAAQN